MLVCVALICTVQIYLHHAHLKSLPCPACWQLLGSVLVLSSDIENWFWCWWGGVTTATPGTSLVVVVVSLQTTQSSPHHTWTTNIPQSPVPSDGSRLL